MLYVVCFNRDFYQLYLWIMILWLNFNWKISSIRWISSWSITNLGAHFGGADYINRQKFILLTWYFGRYLPGKRLRRHPWLQPRPELPLTKLDGHAPRLSRSSSSHGSKEVYTNWMLKQIIGFVWCSVRVKEQINIFVIQEQYFQRKVIFSSVVLLVHVWQSVEISSEIPFHCRKSYVKVKISRS